jgi:hypothetical protein
VLDQAEHQGSSGASGTSGSGEVQDQVEHLDQRKCRIEAELGTSGLVEVLDRWSMDQVEHLDLVEVQ